ncbi:MAG: hypothetical protein CFE44_05975 [Burkholderiales bacterium PBB4]|nr:MAG: hypothetical protein CFE44_05975 [Burkholderiales bacterium PBB4]
MEFLVLIALVVGFWVLKNREQQQRIALLGGVLSRFEIEKLMQTLMDGYLRALGESTPERQAQVLAYLAAQEERLVAQFQQFADAFAQVWADDALISTLPLAFPWAHKIFPASTFDGRALMQIHAQALAAVCQPAPADAPPQQTKDRAFAITAELLLIQHSCHWFCRSRAVASARLLTQHKTPYAQVLATVAPATRTAYRSLTGQ